ncbi:MAG: hypothetical protein KAH18_11445 [Psychromonas sp.]|nr:hypothetical protein [Psychromonas sp.]
MPLPINNCLFKSRARLDIIKYYNNVSSHWFNGGGTPYESECNYTLKY